MQVRPERSQRGKQPDPARAVDAIPSKNPARDRQKQQGEQMRPRMIMQQQRIRGEQRRHDGEQRVGAGREHRAKQHGDECRDDHSAHEHDAFQSKCVVQCRKQDLGAPFVRNPRRARLREGERVGNWNLPVVQNPIADGQVNRGIAIPQQAAPAGARGHERPSDYGQEEQVAQRGCQPTPNHTGAL